MYSYIYTALPLLFIVLTSYAANQPRAGVMTADSPSLLHSCRRPRILQPFEDTNLYDVKMKFLPQQEHTKGSCWKIDSIGYSGKYSPLMEY